MTDKVQKIREEVERLQNELIQEKRNGFGSNVDDACILELQNVLTYIDSLQEEPVAPKVLEDTLNAKTAAESLGISQEEHDRIVDELIYGKEPELVDVDDLPNKEEEPVSKDLEKGAVEAFRQIVDSDKNNFLEIFKAGAKWQEKKDQETIETAIHHAYHNGRLEMKEQMMAKAFDFTKEHNTACVLASECLRGNGWFSKERDFNDLFRHLSCVDELFKGKFSGKTKVIVIKED